MTARPLALIATRAMTFRGRGGWLLGAAIVAGLPGPARAQEPWRASYFPYVVGGPTDGVMPIARYQLTRNAPYFLSKSDDRDVINPLSFAGAASAEAGVGTRGSRFVSLVFRGPGLVDGWRFHGILEARRDGRLGYGVFGAESASSTEDDFLRVRRNRYQARAEVTRRIQGPFRAALAASIERTEFFSVTTPSLFGTVPVQGTDAGLRLTLVFDTRDREFVPGNGVLLEAGGYVGTDGIDPDVQDDPPRAAYTGGFLHLRGYVSPREGTVVAARFALRGLSTGAPLSARYQMPGWERELTVLGGVDSHRGFVRGRFPGRGVLLGSLEVRHDLLNAGDFGAITLLGFVDGGRVFVNEPVELSSRGWEISYGGGLALRILRSAILTFNFAGGGEGFGFSTGTGWSF